MWSELGVDEVKKKKHTRKVETKKGKRRMGWKGKKR